MSKRRKTQPARKPSTQLFASRRELLRMMAAPAAVRAADAVMAERHRTRGLHPAEQGYASFAFRWCAGGRAPRRAEVDA